MSRTDGMVEVGKLNDRVAVLSLLKTTGEAGTAYAWEPVRRTWAQTELMTKTNVYSVHGIGAAGVSFTLRRQPLDLDSALRWRGQHCLKTAIRPLGRM